MAEAANAVSAPRRLSQSCCGLHVMVCRGFQPSLAVTCGGLYYPRSTYSVQLPYGTTSFTFSQS